MNRRLFNILMIGAVAGFSLSCNQEDIAPDTPDVPDTPDILTEGYHLTFDGGVGIETGTRAVWNDDKGSGNLIFQWDYTPYPDNATESELKMAFVKDGLWLPSEGNNYVTDVKILEHTDPAKAGDKHWAKFETIETYNPKMGENVYDGHTIYAVTPINDTNASTMVVDVNSGELSATLKMPATFTQVADQEPDFLRNYMYMYATSIIANGSASLSFKHIPATFRFIITNKRPTEANITSVQVSLADAVSVASKSATINDEGVTFSQDAHTAITTQLGENGTTVQKDATYTAYALALPLTDNAAFNGKQIKFTIEASNPDNEYLSFVLDADKLAGSNPNNEYNWVGGKSYTIRMSLNDVLTFDGITVGDWTQTDIDSGVAEELIPNSFDATAMTADELNAAVATALAAGYTDIEVTLKPDAPAEMFTAIRRALLDTEGVADGSINLTLKGVTAIPDHNNSAKEGPAIFGVVIQDENGQYLDEKEWVTQLATINLPDVTEIGARAFYSCENLISITAPKVLYIGEYGLNATAITSIDMPLLKEAGFAAFFGTALTEVYLPSLETVGNTAFRACTQLQTVDLPKLQNLSQLLFGDCTSLVSVNVPEATSVAKSAFWYCSELVSITLPGVTELAATTFERCAKLENITLGSVITQVDAKLFGDEALSSGITLTLHPDQATSDTLPATAGTNIEWAGFTWKEVKFAVTE